MYINIISAILCLENIYSIMYYNNVKVFDVIYVRLRRV